MKKGDICYIILKNLSLALITNLEYSVGLRAFHITSVGRIYAEGFYFERFGNLSDGGVGHNIITKKKKKKGIEIPFDAYESVAIGSKMRIGEDIFTFGEAQLELIKYISNEFQDASDFEDESYSRE